MDRAACVQVYGLMDPTRIENCESSENFGQILALTLPSLWKSLSYPTDRTACIYVHGLIVPLWDEMLNPVKNLAKSLPI